jgi:hypothetical protein
VRVHVRNIAASCPKCGGEEFEPNSGKRFELASQTVMRCAGCGATLIYLDLVLQIADKAITLSNAMLEEMRRRRSR